MIRLYVKSFGPLKEIDIELNHINLFIGENGSGKSVLGKLITIFLNFNGFLQGEDVFQQLKEFQIDFLDESSIIKLSKEDQKDEPLVEVKDKTIHFSAEFSEEKDKVKIGLLMMNGANDLRQLESFFSKLGEEEKKDVREFMAEFIKNFVSGDEERIKEWLKAHEELNSTLERAKSQYIPAERNLISLFNQSLSSFILAEIPLPKFLLHFSSEYQKARKQITELALLNVTYRNGDGERIYYNDQASLPLEHSSSGIQAALPLYLTAKYFGKKHHAIIIEEPELNLFPKAQCQTIHYLVEQMNTESRLFLMTHSPYVLSSLNILLYAYKVGSLNEKAKEKVSALVPESQWINPDKFSAYYLENGTVRSLKGSTGLIGDNEIDESSDEIDSEFNELVEIYREHKHDR